MFVVLVATCAAGADNQPSYQQGKITGWSNQLFERNFTINVSFPKATRKYYELNGSQMVYQVECGFLQPAQIQIGQVVDYRVDDQKIYIRQANGNGKKKEQTCRIASYKVIAGANTSKPSSAAPLKRP